MRPGGGGSVGEGPAAAVRADLSSRPCWQRRVAARTSAGEHCWSRADRSGSIARADLARSRAVWRRAGRGDDARRRSGWLELGRIRFAGGELAQPGEHRPGRGRRSWDARGCHVSDLAQRNARGPRQRRAGPARRASRRWRQRCRAAPKPCTAPCGPVSAAEPARVPRPGPLRRPARRGRPSPAAGCVAGDVSLVPRRPAAAASSSTASRRFTRCWRCSPASAGRRNTRPAGHGGEASLGPLPAALPVARTRGYHGTRSDLRALPRTPPLPASC